MQDLPDQVVLIGQICSYSDAGDQAEAFSVVEIAPGRCVIVATDRLQKIDSGQFR